MNIVQIGVCEANDDLTYPIQYFATTTKYHLWAGYDIIMRTGGCGWTSLAKKI